MIKKVDYNKISHNINRGIEIWTSLRITLPLSKIVWQVDQKALNCDFVFSLSVVIRNRPYFFLKLLGFSNICSLSKQKREKVHLVPLPEYESDINMHWLWDSNKYDNDRKKVIHRQKEKWQILFCSIVLFLCQNLFSPPRSKS